MKRLKGDTRKIGDDFVYQSEFVYYTHTKNGEKSIYAFHKDLTKDELRIAKQIYRDK